MVAVFVPGAVPREGISPVSPFRAGNVSRRVLLAGSGGRGVVVISVTSPCARGCFNGTDGVGHDVPDPQLGSV